MKTAPETPAPPDPNEDFLRLWTHHEPELRSFVHACLPRAAEVDEVMQNVSLVAWRKFSTLVDRTQFPRWACLIARYEILMARRRHARDRLVLSEDIMARLAEEGMEEMPVRSRQLDVLDRCIAKLPSERRELVLAAYAPGTSKRDLAVQVGRTEGSLYQLLARIRQELLHCIEHTLAQEAHLR
jgi:RNA polymerase sigma-70 factor (ECF subfamily)